MISELMTIWGKKETMSRDERRADFVLNNSWNITKEERADPVAVRIKNEVITGKEIVPTA